MTDLIPIQSGAASAAIHPSGAHVTSWIPAGGEERLFVSSATEFGAGKAIRGGIPVIFPQFSDYGPFARHGFARNRLWTSVGDPSSTARFELADDGATRELWPHRFTCQLEATLQANELTVRLSVTNPGDEPFEFTAALHTYLRVDDIASVRVEGLSGMRFRDNNDRSQLQVDHEDTVTFPGEIDRAYFDVPRQLTVRDDERVTTIQSDGFPDAVVWNPGPEKSAALRDMEPDGYRRFVCLESAAVQHPVRLDPGSSWSGMQRLIA